MTYSNQCLNCGCDLFIFDPQDYQFVRLHPMGGIYQTEGIPGERTWDEDKPEQVTCTGCGLEVERERLDPSFDWDRSKRFQINVREKIANPMI